MFHKRVAKAIKWRTRKVARRLFPDLQVDKFMDDEFLTYAYKKKLGALQNADTIEMIALRGSGADYNFVDRNTGTSYNLGLTSSDLHATYHLYRFSADLMPNLKHVFVFFAPAIPGLNLNMLGERYRCVAYKYFFDIPYQSRHRIKRRVERRIVRKCAGLAAPMVPEDYRGYDEKKYLSPEFDIVKRAAAHLRENQREPDQMGWLDATLKLAEKNGHKVWIVIAPVRADFKALLPEASILFSKLYNMEIGDHRILDFYDDASFDDSDHGDTDHLNREGAAKLTDKIMSVLESET